MIDLDILDDGDTARIVREGARVARTLALTVEGLKHWGSLPEERDFELLLDLALDAKLLFERAEQLQTGATATATDPPVPKPSPSTAGPDPTVLPFRPRVPPPSDAEPQPPDGDEP